MPDNIREIAEEAARCLPFMVAAGANGEQQVNINRMLEAVIIAAVLGLGGYLLLIPELKAEFNAVKSDVHEIGQDVKELSADVMQLKIDVAVDAARHDKEKK